MPSGSTQAPERGTRRWWARAVLVTVPAPMVGIWIVGALWLPVVNRMTFDTRVERFWAWMPGVVAGALIAGCLAGLLMGVRRWALLVPAGAAAVVSGLGYLSAMVFYLWVPGNTPDWLGLLTEGVGYAAEVGVILYVLRFGPLGRDDPSGVSPSGRPSARKE